MKYLEMDMPACLGDMGHQAVYLKTRAQQFNRRKSTNKKLKALRCLQVNTYFGRMKHWPATQSSSSTADASIDNDERYAYRDGGVEVVGGESDQTVGVSRPGDLVTRSATTDVEMPAVAGDGRCDVLAVVDFDPVVAPARPPLLVVQVVQVNPMYVTQCGCHRSMIHLTRRISSTRLVTYIDLRT